MDLKSSAANPPSKRALPSLLNGGSGHDNGQRGVYEERNWRCIADVDRSIADGRDILVSRWIDSRNVSRQERHEAPSDRHIIGVSLSTARLRLASGAHTIFEGIMPAGTMHVTSPSQMLTADFREPCEFIHFHVSHDYFQRCQGAARSDPAEVVPDLSNHVIRDPLAELLGRSLIRSTSFEDALYAERVGQTLVMHIARLRLSRRTVAALQMWRLRRVQQYIDTHLDGSLSLSGLAAVAGLSPMHFAAQFRAATGCSPHEYILGRRIEIAKATLLNTDTSLAQVALSVGFHAQSHFSTVFKRLTGASPASWRRMIRSERPDQALFAQSFAEFGKSCRRTG
jgi:AraC family transcriptional regulator